MAGRALIAAAAALAATLGTAGSAQAFGTFGEVKSYDTGGSVFGIAVADLDRDGNPDILASNDGGNDHISLLLGKGNGKFKAEKRINDRRGPEGIAIARFDGDKWLDFAVADYADGGETSKVSIFRGKGGGKFELADKLPAPGAWIIEARDLDRDGALDLVTGNYDTDGTDALSVFRGKANGSFRPRHDYAGTTGNQTGMTLAKMNDDNLLDAVTTDLTGTYAVVPGEPGAKFGTPNPTSNPGVSYGYQVATGNFADEVDTDAVFPQYSTNLVELEYGDGAGGFFAGLTVASPGGPNGIAVGDIDRDGDDDVIVGRYGASGFTPVPWVTDTLVPGTPVAGTSPAETVALARLNGDRGLDVILGTDDGLDVYLNQP